MRRDIVTIGHPILRQPTRPVTPDELASAETQAFIDDLIETMRAANGAGLAANQVAEPIRICAIEVKDNPRYPYKPNIPLTVLVNPVLTPIGDEMVAINEGCLSVPDLRGEVNRFVRLQVSALDRFGQPIDSVVTGLTAGTYQHEVDHLDGMLFVDRVHDPATLTTWANYERFHRAAFIERITEFVQRVDT